MAKCRSCDGSGILLSACPCPACDPAAPPNDLATLRAKLAAAERLLRECLRPVEYAWDVTGSPEWDALHERLEAYLAGVQHE